MKDEIIDQDDPEVTIRIDLEKILSGIGSQTGGKRYFTDDDLADILCRIDERFQGCSPSKTTAELVGWAPGWMYIDITWHIAQCAWKLSRSTSDGRMVPVV